jgi:hypothetical protein
VAAEKKRGTQTVRDMVFSVAVAGLTAGVIYLFIPHDEDKDPVRVVDYSVEVKTASRAAPYPVATPRGLSDEWRATSVRFEGAGSDGGAWHLGFMSPDNEYATVEQSDADPKTFVDDVTFGAEKTGRTVRLAGETWTRYEGEKYDALVRTEPEVTTVVAGTAPLKQLKQLAAALEPGTAQG